MKKMLFLFCAGAGLMITACNTNEPEGGSDNGTPVRFTSNIKLSAYPQSRVVDQTWETNDEIGVFMFETGSSNISDNAENKKYTVSEGGSQGVFASDAANTIYYPRDGSGVDFVAYYPHSAEVTDFIYEIDLSDQGVQSDLDFMLAAKVVNKTSADAAANLTFYHRLSKMILNVSNGGDSSIDLSTLQVVIKGMNTTAEADLLTGAISNEGGAAQIGMFKNGTSFEAILLPASLNATHTIEFVIADKTYIWNVSDDITSLAGANKYIYDIELSNTPSGGVAPLVEGTITAWTDNTGSAQADLAESDEVIYAPGDYYPDPAADVSDPGELAAIEGIVYEVSNGGKSGKIVSLTEVNGMVWGPNRPDYNDNQDDGSVNFATVKALDATFSAYPPLAWCLSLGEGWYIPASNEVIALRAFWYPNQTEVNTKLIAAGGGALYVQPGINVYMSSTEDESSRNKILGFGFNNTTNESPGLKQNIGGAEVRFLFRAVKKF